MLKRGLRSTLLVTERFVELAQATYESRDLPDGPMILLPKTETTEYSDRTTMERIADETFQRFLAAIVAAPGPRVRA